MLVCPRCSYENEDSATNCASCGINLPWALANLHEVVQPKLERVEGPPPEGPTRNRVVRGFLTIVLLLAIPASGFLAFLFAFTAGWSDRSYRSAYMAAAWFWVAVAVVCILAAIAVLLPRRLRPRYYRGLQILGLITLAGGLLYGLMRLTLVILPEHTGHSLIIQYTLGERDFSSVTLEGADLREADLRKANLSGANLGRADLREAELYRADLSGADLREANLSGAEPYQASLSGANLRGADLHQAYLYRTNLRGADLREARLFQANLSQANLSGAGLSGADLRGADLEGANLTGADLRKASLLGAVFDDATQIDAKWRLVHSILTLGAKGWDLSGADLSDADLHGSDLSEADLSEADLSSADLCRTYLFAANLRGADLSGADMRRANLRKANLEGATVTNEQLAEAGSLEGTILPDGSVHE